MGWGWGGCIPAVRFNIDWVDLLWWSYSIQVLLTNIPGDRPLYPGILTDTPGKSVADRSLYTLSLTDIPVALYTPSIYPRLLTNTSRYNVAGRSSYTLSLTDIWVYTSSDRPLYPGLLTDIPGYSVADNGLRILCCWQIFRYTIQVTGRYKLHYLLTQGYSVADRLSYTVLLTDIPVYKCQGAIPRVTDWYTG